MEKSSGVEPINDKTLRDKVKEIVDDFPAIREKFRNDSTKDDRALSTQKDFAAGYLEAIMNLSDDERKGWGDEIDGLVGILRVWEYKNDPSQW